MTIQPATVKELIEQLQKLPPDLPCYFRPKYYGPVGRTDEVPINFHGISLMEPDIVDKRGYVCFLC